MDIGSGEGEGERDVDEPPQMADFSIKALKLSGLTVELGNEHVQDTKLNGMYQSTLRRPEVHTRYIQFNVNAPRVLRLWGLMICMPRTWWQK